VSRAGVEPAAGFEPAAC